MSKNTHAAGAVVGSTVGTVTALTAAATVPVDPTTGSVFTLTPNQATTVTVSGVNNGEELTLVVVTSGVTSYNVAFGTGFLSTGVLATGTTTAKTFIVKFVAVNGLYTEVSRTTAQ